MDEIRYLISDASKKVDVETHVLRYWEEELGISIPRNEMGHRYYTEFHIQLFCQVKKLKDKGYQLKAIKNALQQVMAHNQGLAETGVFLEKDMSRTLVKSGMQQENERVSEASMAEDLQNTGDMSMLAAEGEACQGAGRLNAPDGESALVDVPGEDADPAESQETEGNIPGEVFREQNAVGKERQEEIFSDDAERFGLEKYAGIMRLSDYSRLEPTAALQVKSAFWGRGKISGEAAEKETDLDVKDQREIVFLAEEDRETLLGSEEKMEEDGQSDMKNRAKTRKKPSAWERRNGVLAAEKRRGEETSESGSDCLAETGEAFFLSRGEKTPIEEDGSASWRGAQEHGMKSGWTERTEENLEDADEDKNCDAENVQTSPVNQEEQEDQGIQGKAETGIELKTLDGGNDFAVAGRDEKMQQFQEIMNYIIGRALEVNNEKLSQEISGLVNRRMAEELEDLMRIRDEREEERYRQLDEIIRNFQRESQGKAEAAATRIPFFRKKRFGRNGKQIK